MNNLKASELVLAADGSLYHIHLTGQTLADDVFLVGDPDRVQMFEEIFDTIEAKTHNREINAVTGTFQGHRFTALSTGMGTDNIDIIMSELDAAANIDLQSRTLLPRHRRLNLVRIGTSGSLTSAIPTGQLVASQYAIGLDGLINYYQHDPAQLEQDMTEAFLAHTRFDSCFARPYAVSCSPSLLSKAAFDMHKGITVTAPGFYAPQGRNLRIAPSIPDLNEQLATFSWNGLPVTNLEMETSAIYGMGRIMGHNALTICLIIANRADGTFLNDYHDLMKEAIRTIMKRLAQ